MNPLYEVPHNVVAALEVDGIISANTRTSGTNRSLFDVINDHPFSTEECPVCSSPDPRYSVNYDGMRWTPDHPIVRFTSEGLQIEEPANV